MLIASIIVMIVVSVLTASLLSYALQERRITRRHAYWLEARSAAESLVDYAAAQAQSLYAPYEDPTQAPSLDPQGSSPLMGGGALQALQGLLSGGLVDTSVLGSSDPTGLQLVGGRPQAVANQGTWYTVNGQDPANQTFPESSLAGQLVRRYDLPVFARATVRPKDGSAPVTAFASATVTLYRVPLFNDQIVGLAGDLEVSASKSVFLYGSVRANGNLWTNSQGSVESGRTSSLTYLSPVSVAGNVFNLWASSSPPSEGRGYDGAVPGASGGEPLAPDPVYFTNTSSHTSAALNAGRTPMDSSLGADSELLSAGLYIDTSTPAITQALRTVAAADAFRAAATASWGWGLQTQAMQVVPVQPGGLAAVLGYASDGTPITADLSSVIDPPQAPLSTAAGYDPGLGSAAAGRALAQASRWSSKAGLYIRVIVSHMPSGSDAASIAAWTSGGPSMGGAALDLPAGLVGFVPFALSQVGATATVSSGFFDPRQSQGVNLVTLDLHALGAALAAYGSPGSPQAITVHAASTPWTGSLNSADGGWNGIVYVEIVQAGPNLTELLLGRGQVANAHTSLLAQTNGVLGLSVATNAPVCVAGTLNATGTGTNPNVPDDGNGGGAGQPSAEIPMAVVGDAVTLLSPGFFGSPSAAGSFPSAANPSTSGAARSFALAYPASSGKSEVASAFITGIVATNAQYWSGGLFAALRSVETWGTSPLVRGAVAIGFESRVATAPLADPTRVPTPNWGYNVLFSNGVQPPGTPSSLLVRRRAFTDFSTGGSGGAIGYGAALSAQWPSAFAP